MENQTNQNQKKQPKVNPLANLVKKVSKKKDKQTWPEEPEAKPITKSPNLLNATKPALIKATIQKHYFTYANFVKIVIVVTHIIFVGVLGMNLRLLDQIETLEKESNQNYEKLLSLQSETNRIQGIINKTEKLRELAKNTNKLSPQIESFFEHTGNYAKINTVSFTTTSINTSIRTQNALQVAVLMSKYLESGFTEGIVLKSASFSNSGSSEYKVSTDMEILLK